jgi:hypothetical protein
LNRSIDLAVICGRPCVPQQATYVGSAVDQYQPEVYHVYETTGVTG